MSLNYPHIPVGDIAENNLSHLLTFGTGDRKKPENIATKVAIEALNDYENNKVGILHNFKKYTASLLAYGTTIGAPVLAVAGGAYYVLSPYFRDPTRIIREAAGYGYEQLTPGEASSTHSALIGPNGYINTSTFVGALASIGIVDYGFRKVTGFSPVSSVAKWTATMLSSALMYSAYQAGQIAASIYDNQAEKKEEIRKKAHERIFTQEIAAFNDVAKWLSAQAEGAKNSPKQLLALKEIAEELIANVPQFKAGLTALHLQSSEASAILDRLTTAANHIIEGQFNLRSSHSPSDDAYNTELVYMLGENEIKKYAISRKAHFYSDSVHLNTLGVMHSVKKYVNSALAGIGAAAVIEIAEIGLAIGVGKVVNTQFLDGPDLTGKICKIASLAAPLSLYLGYRMDSNMSKDYDSDKVRADKEVEKNKALLEKELKNICEGVARHLQMLKSKAGNSKQKAELTEYVDKIAAKLPLIKQAFASLDGIDDAEDIIMPLKSVLDTIN